MITVFNRKELFITSDSDMQARIREILDKKGVEYTYRTTNLMAGTRTLPGANQANAYEYRFYVKKQDLEYAVHLITDRIQGK